MQIRLTLPYCNSFLHYYLKLMKFMNEKEHVQAAKRKYFWTGHIKLYSFPLEIFLAQFRPPTFWIEYFWQASHERWSSQKFRYNKIIRIWQPYMGKSQEPQQKGEAFYSCTMINGNVAKHGYFWQDSHERKKTQKIELSKIKQHEYTYIIFVSAHITWEYSVLGWWMEKYERRSSQKLGLNGIRKWLN